MSLNGIITMMAAVVSSWFDNTTHENDSNTRSCGIFNTFEACIENVDTHTYKLSSLWSSSLQGKSMFESSKETLFFGGVFFSSFLFYCDFFTAPISSLHVHYFYHQRARSTVHIGQILQLVKFLYLCRCKPQWWW